MVVVLLALRCAPITPLAWRINIILDVPVHYASLPSVIGDNPFSTPVGLFLIHTTHTGLLCARKLYIVIIPLEDDVGRDEQARGLGSSVKLAVVSVSPNRGMLLPPLATWICACCGLC